MMWRRPELRILLVCTANVCRSPLAQTLLQARLRETGLARRVGVGSAGTRVASPGRRPDPRVLRLLVEAGVSVGRIRARQLGARLLAEQDLVLVMESAQLGEVEAIGGSLGAPAELRQLGEFLPEAAGASRIPEIPDPYFSDGAGFRAVYQQVDRAVTGLVAWLPDALVSVRRR